MSTQQTENQGFTELTVSECLALLRSAAIGRLAVVVDGQPDIFPVNHVVDHGTVVFRTQQGAKLAASAGRAVAFEVDGYDVSDATAWSVVVKGRAREVRDTYAALEALQLPIFPWHAGNKPFIVRIEPETITGRRFPVAGGVQAAKAPAE